MGEVPKIDYDCLALAWKEEAEAFALLCSKVLGPTPICGFEIHYRCVAGPLGSNVPALEVFASDGKVLTKILFDITRLDAEVGCIIGEQLSELKRTLRDARADTSS